MCVCVSFFVFLIVSCSGGSVTHLRLGCGGESFLFEAMAGGTLTHHVQSTLVSDSKRLIQLVVVFGALCAARAEVCPDM